MMLSKQLLKLQAVIYMVIYMRYRCLFRRQIMLLYAVAYATQTGVGGYRYGG